MHAHRTCRAPTSSYVLWHTWPALQSPHDQDAAGRSAAAQRSIAASAAALQLAPRCRAGCWSPQAARPPRVVRDTCSNAVNQILTLHSYQEACTQRMLIRRPLTEGDGMGVFCILTFDISFHANVHRMSMVSSLQILTRALGF